MSTVGTAAIAAAVRRPPSHRVRATAVLVALGLLAFAMVNVLFEGVGRFSAGPYAAYADGLTVMNWLVVGLKVLGAGVVLASVSRWAESISPTAMTMLLWGAFATFAVYATGTLVQAIALASGLAGSRDQITLGSFGYLVAAVLFATGLGIVAVSYSRRAGLRKGAVVLGVLGAPVLLAGVLVGAPFLLGALGIMPNL